MTDPHKPASPGEVKAALEAAAGLGMFFRLADARPADPRVRHSSPSAGGWQPVALLYASGSEVLDAMLDDTAARLGGCERRVAASLLFQGYAARLLSPQVGCLVTSGCVPAVPTAWLRWRQPDSEVVQLGLEAGTGWRGPADVLTGIMLTQSFDGHLRPLAAALRARVRIAATVLRDNAASALVGALRLADDKIVPGWRFLADMALAHPLLRGSGAVGPDEPAFVRRSCCLYYRVEGGGLCGDCPLAAGVAHS